MQSLIIITSKNNEKAPRRGALSLGALSLGASQKAGALGMPYFVREPCLELIIAIFIN